jgi:hypothetical protein
VGRGGCPVGGLSRALRVCVSVRILLSYCLIVCVRRRAVHRDVLCAAAHASFSHAEYAIAEYLDAEGLGEGEGGGEDDAEDTDMQDANFVHDPSADRQTSE